MRVKHLFGIVDRDKRSKININISCLSLTNQQILIYVKYIDMPYGIESQIA